MSVQDKINTLLYGAVVEPGESLRFSMDEDDLDKLIADKLRGLIDRQSEGVAVKIHEYMGNQYRFWHKTLPPGTYRLTRIEGN